MASRRQPAGRKRRTREHVIADLGVNHVERVVLECGFAVERRRTDYGTDLLIETFDRRRELEVGTIELQVKATDALTTSADGEVVLLRVAVAHLKDWLFEVVPVVVALYDARAGVGYWLDVQDYARGSDIDLDAPVTATLRIPAGNVWSVDVVRQLRVMKNQLVDRMRRLPDAD